MLFCFATIVGGLVALSARPFHSPVVTTTLTDWAKGEVGSQAYVPESMAGCARRMMSEVTMSCVRRLITMVPTRLRSWVMI